MSSAVLNVASRDKCGKGVARSLRRAALIPAVIYGKGMEPCAISVDPKDLRKAISTEAGWNTLMTLKGDGAFDGKQVILKDLQVDAIRRDILHADFHAIDLKSEVHVMVPVQPVGKSKGEKEGGDLQIIRHELEIVCLPTAIPAAIEIDVTGLDIGGVVHVQDVVAPAGVTIPHDVNFTILTVTGRKAETEEVEGAEEAAAEE